MVSSPSHAGVKSEDCAYSKRGNHNVQEREYDKLLASLHQGTKNKRKKRKNKAKGLK